MDNCQDARASCGGIKSAGGIILAAADYGESKKGSSPPLALEYAIQAETYSALPNKGGLRDQPYNLILQMRTCLNIYNAFKGYYDNNFSVEWTRSHPELWNIIGLVTNLRGDHEDGKDISMTVKGNRLITETDIIKYVLSHAKQDSLEE